MSKLSMKRSMTETAIAPPACLPSDSEEEESDSSEEEEEEDSDSDSDENDDSELFQGKTSYDTVFFSIREKIF